MIGKGLLLTMAPQQKRKSVLGEPAHKLKQGSLFSFFSKKPKNDAIGLPAQQRGSSSRGSLASTKDAVVAAPVVSTLASSAPPASAQDESRKKSLRSGSNATSQAKAPTADKVRIGDVVQVYWACDDEWYAAKVVKQRPSSNFYLLEYLDDSDSEWLDLGVHTFRRCSGKSKTRRHATREQNDVANGGSDDEMSVSSGEPSAYEEGNDSDNKGDDDGDEDQWMASDVEDANEGKKAPRKKRLFKVTLMEREKSTPVDHEKKAENSSSPTARAPKHVTPALSYSSVPKNTPLLTQFSHATPTAFASAESDRKRATASKSKQSANPSMDLVSSATKEFAAKCNKSSSPTMFVRDAVNPAGSHVHHHLRFLREPRDAKGRSPGEADYDPRTLTVVEKEWERVCGSKMTNAVVQWWDLKKQYFDTVLLFKTGKFYEMFHMDADVGVQVCDLSYMKGHVAHAGFPEISYASMAEKLVNAGYKVARVEQTETPEQLQERKKRTVGVKPKVVNREVCNILTSGTRTWCYLEQQDSLLEQSLVQYGSSTGPLLAVSEVLTEAPDVDLGRDSDAGSVDNVLPVCEYGVTLVDAVRGTVTVGQFADDVLRSRMNTLLATYEPSEVLLQGGGRGASAELRSLLRLAQNARPGMRMEVIQPEELFPKSTAIDPSIRRQLERGVVHPWDVRETLEELHRRRYYPQASKTKSETGINRWPPVLKAAVEGGASLLLSSFGAALFYLQRSLIDAEILSLGIVKAYIPPTFHAKQDDALGEIHLLAKREQQREAEIDVNEVDEPLPQVSSATNQVSFAEMDSVVSSLETPSHMSLDGTTLHNLEILHNSTDLTSSGSLWSIINHTKTPHGSRLLRAWLLRPLFRKAEIDRRADAVQELVSGSAAVAMAEAQSILAKCGDIERLLARVHSMSGSFRPKDYDEDNDVDQSIHPNERAILYETKTYTKRKVGDFSKVLNSLRVVARIPEVFVDVDIQSGLLKKVVRTVDHGGCFPDMSAQLDWFFENFDCEKAARGEYEPMKGIDDDYDNACALIERIEAEFKDYKNRMCSILKPRDLARSSWKYINTSPDSKDKYLIELPVGVAVPDEFIVKGKRGSGSKQVNKYRTPTVDRLVRELDKALEVQKERKARGMQLIFAKFDSIRALWAAASTATALLDALGSLAMTSSNQGYARPVIVEASQTASSSICVLQGRHPCVEKSLGPGNFVPNDLALGVQHANGSFPRVLLLSGVNMGGKSTCLRQTCLIAILAQIGCFVPAEECRLTPIDRIYTRLGASDRILLGQSTFFVELAETAAALRGATQRSLVIMDELGRGTSTFDGTAIASATVLHLVERTKCMSLFATHYHSLLDEWQGHPNVQLGHMECVVENASGVMRGAATTDDDGAITFLYTLGEGGCPKSFGINVARLARLPQEVVVSARQASSDFESDIKERMTNANTSRKEKLVIDAIKSGKWNELLSLQQSE